MVISGRTFAMRALSSEDGIGRAVWNRLYRRRLFESVRFEEGRVYEDVALLPAIADQVDAAVVVEQPLYHHCAREGSITQAHSAANFSDYLQAQLEVLDYLPGLGDCDTDYLHAYEASFAIATRIMCQWTDMLDTVKAAC